MLGQLAAPPGIQNPMKIMLLRHGKPDFSVHWLNPKEGVKHSLNLYATSRVTTAVPDELSTLSSSVDTCVTSELIRTIDSAKLLGFKVTTASALFNESELPFPNRLLFPLSWKLFLVLYRLLWFFGCSQNCPGKLKDKERARLGSVHLANLAANNEVVLLIGHGIINRLICSELQKSGWSIDDKSGLSYWSSITLSYPHL